MGNQWQTVSQSNPCPICQKPDWCAISTDGAAAICRRIQRSDGEHRVDGGGADFWIYRLNGAGGSAGIGSADSYSIDMPSLPATGGHTGHGGPGGNRGGTPIPCAAPEFLHRAYSALLAELPLLERHKENLTARGLTDQQIAAAQYRSWPTDERAALCRAVIQKLGGNAADELKTVPGFYLKSASRGFHYYSLTGSTGLAIPVRDDQARIVALKIRVDEPQPGGGKYFYVSSAQHGGPGPGAPLHHPVTLPKLIENQERIFLRFTEGELKADVATALSGVRTISIPGVMQWRKAVEWLKSFRSTRNEAANPDTNRETDREAYRDKIALAVFVAFDNDAWDNLQVATAIKNFVESLCANDFYSVLEIWNA